MMLEVTQKVAQESDQVILLKWRRKEDLFESLLNGSHELSSIFLRDFRNKVREVTDINVFGSVRLRKSDFAELYRDVWLGILRGMTLILIDMPDYSKTDRRAMARDLQDVYWWWNDLAKTSVRRPNFVIAVQKEMFAGHFFFDKMVKVELGPLAPDQMLEAYLKGFETAGPFTEDALLTLARMSRGIFRRFLRYITLTLDLWERRREPRDLIDSATVREAVTVERLAEDMELELMELFPKQSDLRLQAVRLLMYLQESGPKKQGELAEEFGLEEYAMSRLLAKLELHRYIVRRREGTDKIVSLRNET
jgi:hypothetical protein